MNITNQGREFKFYRDGKLHMWRSLLGRNITNQGREFTGMEHYKSCLAICRDGTLQIMSRNLQGRNITNQGREFTGMELSSVCNGRRTHYFNIGYFTHTDRGDRQTNGSVKI